MNGVKKVDAKQRNRQDCLQPRHNVGGTRNLGVLALKKVP